MAYRAFYALPETITTSSGTMTNAVYGFTSMLMKLIEEKKPDLVICAFDSKAPTFRHKIFKEYKLHRKKMPDELASQISLIKEVLKTFGIICLEKEGYEADDILAAVARSTASMFKEIMIVTGDKDALQLVSDNIKVMAIKKGITDTVIYDKQKVREKFGVNPENMKDLLALVGDSSDNIPGIPGIGPKTASFLISEYGSIKNIYNNIDKLKNENIKNLLLEYKEQTFNSKKLAELISELEINIDDIIKRSFRNIDFKKIEELFNSLEFKTLKKRLKNLYIFEKKGNKYADKVKDNKVFGLRNGSKKINLKILEDESDFDKLYKNIDKRLYIVPIVNRFYKGNIFDKRLIEGIILHPGKEVSYFAKKKIFGENSFIGEKIKSLLKDKNISKSGFDFKYIYKLLKNFDMEPEGKFIDYKIIYLILNSYKSDTTVDEIIKDLLAKDIKELNHFEKIIQGSLEDYTAINDYKDNDKKLDFARAVISFYPQLEKIMLKKLKDESLDRLYFEIEEPLIKVLAEMEYKGVNIDKEYLESLIRSFDLEIKKISEEIFHSCGQIFNINSPQQLSDILYNKLGLPVVKKTKTGLSTDASALLSICNAHPVITKILDYREKVKLKNTYIDVLPNLINSEDNRIHTTYNQLGTSTGRISSSEPNLQNIPIRTELGRQIRKAFIPGDNYNLILTADYSQIELRILAHFSEDEELINIFSRGEDIHARTASEIFGVSYKNVDELLRRKAKAINFGIIYGMTEYGLKNRLSISEEEAREYINMYFDRFPGVKKYIHYLVELAYKRGYTTTIFGRKRYINELGSSNIRLRNLGERLAINTPIQGSAADIMKLSTVILYHNLKSKNIDANIILQVHDELVLELREDDLKIVKEIVKNSMENCMKLKVKLKIDIKTGKNWYI